VLGGHSLLVTQVVSRVREALEVDLPLRSLFEAPTVAGLARRIEELRSELSGAQIAPLVRYSRDQALPLSFAQQRLWFVDQLTPGMALYNVPGRLRLSGSLDQSALQRALDEMWRRHEILRTRFPAVDGQPIQHIDPAAPVDWSLIDLRDSAPEARQAEVRRLFAEQARSSFDLAAGPLARVLLILLRDDEALMIHTMHHTITDGWSVDIFSRELRALYAAFRDDRESPLHDLPIQYGDFAIWQRSWLQGEVLERQVNYWRNQLRGLATLELPTDRPRPPVQAFNGASYNFALPLELTSQLRELSRQQGVTLFMTLLAGFKTLLGRYSGQDDIVIGAPIAGRNRRELEGLIGFFVNTLVLRCNLSGDPSFVQLVQRVREVCLGAYAHQDLPFDKLVDEIQPRRDPSRNPLFQVVFGLQNMPQSRELPQGSPKRPGNEKAPNQNTLSGNGTSKFDLGLQCFESPQGLRCVIGYNTDLFDSATITRFAVHYHALLRDIVADPHRSLWAFSLVDSSSAVSMQPGQSPEQSATVDESTDLLSTQLDQLSDEELAALLEKTLAEREKES
jgi:non-ribosomal peptide synthetase component F